MEYNSFPANISTLFQRIVVRLIWNGDLTQRQINVLFVKVKIYISTLILTTLDNVETMLLFSMSSFTTLINVETTLWI